MRFVPTRLPGVILVEPQRLADDRGQFMETFHAEKFRAAGIDFTFTQDNASRSLRNVLRGLHFQEPRAQGKLIRVVAGSIFDVAVDIRRGSPHFGQWVGSELSAENGNQLWVPPGFAHGFCVTSESADVIYKCTDVYVRECDRGILWNDPAIGIEWPVAAPLLSPKDQTAPRLADAPLLPSYG
jgi:dTDP-4-dehydrorhamnose 3,5-epimerase